ncbi:MAG: C39 family peptidase [Patescibacteria group bacterium]
MWEPFLQFDGNNYTLWYGGHDGTRWAMGSAYSVDGVNWIKNLSNPFLSFIPSDPQEQHVHTPTVIKEGTLLKIWYTSSPDDVSNFKIEFAESLDGVSFTRHSTPVIIPTQAWESQGVANPSVLKVGNTYHIWYSGLNGGSWKIGHATSSDGVNWIKNFGPTLQPSLSWEGNSVAAPSVILLNDVYHMYYHAGPTTPKYIGHATSNDSITWTKDVVPILQTGGFASWDTNLIAAPSVDRVFNRLKLFYSGHSGTTWRIGVAEELLPVPYYSQKDPLWANDEYDDATNWANPNSQTMAAVGCAVTSAAMILNHFNVQKTPGNPDTGLPPKILTPATLNEWLKSRNDGSYRNGLTNWPLLARMTKLANNLEPTSPKLEYFASPSGTLSTIISSDVPVILNLPYPSSPSNTHFVVATKVDGGTFSINDPFYENQATLDPYYPTVNRLGYFKPTNSDFSYLTLAFDASVSAILKNPNGIPVGDTTIEQPIFDQVNQTSSGAEPLKLISLKQPPSGLYTLELSAPTLQTFQLDSYIYDNEGEVESETFTGSLVPGISQKLYLTIDHDEVGNSELMTSYDLFRLHIKELYQSGDIKSKTVYNKLLYEANKVEKMSKKGPTGVRIRLEGVLVYIEGRQIKFLTQEAYQILKSDVQNLLAQF